MNAMVVRKVSWDCLLVAAAAAVVLALLPAGARAVTFGADLNRPVNNTIDCTAIFVPSPGLGVPSAVYPSNATSCTYFGAGSATNSTETFNVPSGLGTVSRVRVKVGPVTGPMQVIVQEALREPLGSIPACCKAINQSAVFTPAPNAVTTVEVQFPVRNDPAPIPGSKYVAFDSIALSVLAPGVPIPAQMTGNPDPLSQPLSSAWFPAISPPQERAGPAGIGDMQVLMNADWDPVAPAAPRTVISLIQPVARVRRGRAVFSLRCGEANPCAGFVLLQNQLALAALAAATKPQTFGKKKINIPAGQTRKVKVTLSKKGKRLLRRRKSASVFLNVSLAGKTSGVGKLKLKRK